MGFYWLALINTIYYIVYFYVLKNISLSYCQFCMSENCVLLITLMFGKVILNFVCRHVVAAEIIKLKA